ncbi:hypothetical protein ACFVJ5_15685 [Nocardia sp. NPDC127606]
MSTNSGWFVLWTDGGVLGPVVVLDGVVVGSGPTVIERAVACQSAGRSP